MSTSLAQQYGPEFLPDHFQALHYKVNNIYNISSYQNLYPSGMQEPPKARPNLVTGRGARISLLPPQPHL